MLNQAIILAGGFGTRLQTVVQDLPKPMADVAGKPFIDYLFKYLLDNKIEEVILSVGYKSEIIIEHCENKWKNEFQLNYVIEDTPLGTGGALLKSLSYVTHDHVLVLNGDTYFALNIHDMYEQHLANSSDFTIGLKPMKSFDRYGTVDIDSEDRILAFQEKKKTDIGLINGGVYIVKQDLFDAFDLNKSFSLEKDFLEPFLLDLKVFGYQEDSYFIDIGVPEDYYKAQDEFHQF
jgi:D-glycero-alpha-D-manno-heptose 1-phosphate guanylyltransferase